MSVVHIVEVGLRDGLQNTSKKLSVKARYQIVKKLSEAGLKRIELGSFVSPQAIPQMINTAELTKKVLLNQSKKILPRDVSYSAFVPNEVGFNKAIEKGLKEVSVFISCTDTFSKKNINKTVNESLKSLQKITRLARALKVKVRGYLSAAFYCPYEGKVSPPTVARLADRMVQEGVFELSISDTVGVAVYSDVVRLMERVQKKVSVKKIALHFHDTRGSGLANVVAGLHCGVRVFDSSIGGLGGCPYVPGASGNIVTEDLNYLLKKMSFKTYVSTQKLIQVTKLLEKTLQYPLPSKLSKIKTSSNH